MDAIIYWTKFEDFHPVPPNYILLYNGKTRGYVVGRVRDDGLLEEIHSGKIWYHEYCPYTHWVYLESP